MMQEQQREFKKIIPKAMHVLNNHSAVLSIRELGILNEYILFITNKQAVINNTTMMEAKQIIKYLSRI